MQSFESGYDSLPDTVQGAPREMKKKVAVDDNTDELNFAGRMLERFVILRNCFCWLACCCSSVSSHTPYALLVLLEVLGSLLKSFLDGKPKLRPFLQQLWAGNRNFKEKVEDDQKQATDEDVENPATSQLTPEPEYIFVDYVSPAMEFQSRHISSI